jgi:hypothetical protein
MSGPDIRDFVFKAHAHIAQHAHTNIIKSMLKKDNLKARCAFN